jgi:hypothetical protein
MGDGLKKPGRQVLKDPPGTVQGGVAERGIEGKEPAAQGKDHQKTTGREKNACFKTAVSLGQGHG